MFISGFLIGSFFFNRDRHGSRKKEQFPWGLHEAVSHSIAACLASSSHRLFWTADSAQAVNVTYFAFIFVIFIYII